MSELKHEHSIVIQAPPDKIYAYLSDFPRHTEWNYQPQEIKKISEGPVGVGTIFHTEEEYPRDLSWPMRHLMFPIMNAVLGAQGYTGSEITAMEPDCRFAWTSWAPIRGGKRAMEVDWEILLEPQNGSTRVTQRSHWVPKHRMANPSALAEMITQEVEENLARLKENLER